IPGGGLGPQTRPGAGNPGHDAVGLGVREICSARGLTLPYPPFIGMQGWQPVEKHARRIGLGKVRVTYLPQESGAATNSALAAGTVQFAASGVTPLLSLWDET